MAHNKRTPQSVTAVKSRAGCTSNWCITISSRPAIFHLSLFLAYGFTTGNALCLHILSHFCGPTRPWLSPAVVASCFREWIPFLENGCQNLIRNERIEVRCVTGVRNAWKRWERNWEGDVVWDVGFMATQKPVAISLRTCTPSRRCMPFLSPAHAISSLAMHVHLNDYHRESGRRAGKWNANLLSFCRMFEKIPPF